MILYRAQCDCGYRRSFDTQPRADFALRRHSCERHQRLAEAAGRYEQRMAAVDRTPKPCLHKRAQHQHGTNAAYHLDACRCRPCSRAAVEYDRTRTKQTAYGRWQPYVDAQLVREHVLALREQGVGWKRVGAVAGVSNGAMTKLLYGESARGMAPSRRVRADTAARLLAVTAEQARGDGSLVPADRAWAAIRGLMALGYSKAWISAQIGSGGRALQISEEQIEARTERAVLALAEQVGDTPGPSVRVRRYAEQRGWPTPLQQWAASLGDEAEDDVVDDVVDDIAVERALTGEHLELSKAERVEVARRLLRQGLGASAVAKRLRLSGATAAAVVELARAS